MTFPAFWTSKKVVDHWTCYCCCQRLFFFFKKIILMVGSKSPIVVDCLWLAFMETFATIITDISEYFCHYNSTTLLHVIIILMKQYRLLNKNAYWVQVVPLQWALTSVYFVISEQTIKIGYVPLSPAELFRGGECCTTFVPPESTCNLLCWSKSKTSSPGTSSIGSCSGCIHTKI